MIRLHKMDRFILLILVYGFVLAACSEKPEEPYTQKGEASYYAKFFTGETTASGDIYQQDALTAAHMHLPLGTVVMVTNLENTKSVEVTINDRGPYIEGRIIDLSRAAATELGIIEDGVVMVELKVTKAAEGYTLSDSVATDRINNLVQ